MRQCAQTVRSRLSQPPRAVNTRRETGRTDQCVWRASTGVGFQDESLEPEKGQPSAFAKTRSEQLSRLAIEREAGVRYSRTVCLNKQKVGGWNALRVMGDVPPSSRQEKGLSPHQKMSVAATFGRLPPEYQQPCRHPPVVAKAPPDPTGFGSQPVCLFPTRASKTDTLESVRGTLVLNERPRGVVAVVNGVKNGVSPLLDAQEQTIAATSYRRAAHTARSRSSIASGCENHAVSHLLKRQRTPVVHSQPIHDERI
jgi:hypothetical protein